MNSLVRPESLEKSIGLQGGMRFGLIACACFIASLPALSPYLTESPIPAIFLPVAISFALFIVRPVGEAHWVGAACLSGTVLSLAVSGKIGFTSVVLASGSIIESFVIACVAKRVMRIEQPLANAADVNRLILMAMIFPALFAALPIGLQMIYPSVEIWGREGYFDTYCRWFFSHSLSYIVFGSVVWLALRRRTFEFLQDWWPRRRLAFLATFGTLVISGLIMADVPPLDFYSGRGATNLALLFLPMPWLMIMAGAYQTGGAAIAALVYAVLTIYPASSGWGEVWGSNPGRNLTAMQLYIGMPCAAAFVLAAFVRMVKERNRHLKLLNADLQAALADADESRKAKANFLAMMSHELRTPLNAVIGFSELIKEQSFGPIRPNAYANLATNINSSGQRLLSMIEGMLYATEDDKLISGFTKTHVQFSDAIQVAVTAIATEAAAKNVEVNVKADLPLAMAADPRALQQIFYNILENAVRYGPKAAPVLVILSADGANSIVKIIDSGPGFDISPWKRGIKMPGELSVSPRRGKGSGCGLAVARALAYGHGGHVEIDSVPGQGTTITITFYATHDASSPLIAVA